MIAWYWLIVCASIFTIFGYFICALMVISKESDERMANIVLKTKELKKWEPKTIRTWHHNDQGLRPDEKPDLPKGKYED